jgi:4-hydroxybenzoate polyprenyltransferase
MVFLVKASRPGFWLTSIWFYLLPFGGQLPLSSWVFWLGVFYVGLPLGILIYGANDVTDERTDRLNPRKDSFLFGARPTPSQIRSLPSRIVLIQLPFVLVFYWLLGPGTLLWFGGVVSVTTFYNLWAKDRPIFDTLAQAGYLMVFVLANWLNGLPAAGWPFWVFGAFFAMHSHLFGEIMDIGPDRAAQRRTTAVAVGARATKVLICGFLVAETLLATTIASKLWLPIMLAGGAICFALDAIIWGERSYPTGLVRFFFMGWNLFLLGDIFLSGFM